MPAIDCDAAVAWVNGSSLGSWVVIAMPSRFPLDYEPVTILHVDAWWVRDQPEGMDHWRVSTPTMEVGVYPSWQAALKAVTERVTKLGFTIGKHPVTGARRDGLID